VLRADAVFEGGGVKGIGLVGALLEAEARGYRWVNVAGTSAGALVAALVAAGYRAEELARMLLDLDYRRFAQPRGWGRLPLVGLPLNLIFRLGLYPADPLEEWLAGLLAERGVHTFADLVLPEFAEDPRFRYRLRVVASDLSRRRLVVLPQDARRYGLDPDHLPVARAVRMSLSIPFYYEPVFLPLPGGGRSVIVDGGLLSNFPVWLFDSDGIPPWPTFGIKIVEPGEGRPLKIRGPLSLLHAVVSTMLEAHDARYIEEADFVRTIAVPSTGVGTVEFDLSRERARALLEAGRRAARQFFETWDFDRYVAAFRVKPPPRGRGRRLRTLGPAVSA